MAKFTRSAAVAAAVLLAAASAGGCQRQGGSDDAFGARVRTYLLAHPELLREMSTALQAKEAREAAAAVKPLIRQNAQRLIGDPRDPSVGPAGAKVTVVQFFDYRCPHCKTEAAPAVERLIAAHPDVRWVFKELPIFGAPSQAAARAALAANRAGHYLPVYEGLMAERDVDQAAIDRVLSANGVSPAQAKAVGEGADVTRQLVDVSQLAVDLKIDGTPAFVVGDTMIAGADIPALEQAITAAKAGQ